MFGMFKKSVDMPAPGAALPGRATPIETAATHHVNGQPLKPPFPDGSEQAMFGLGCFWGAERLFWKIPGVVVTAVGYTAGMTPNPTYEEVCSGRTGHNEVVFAAFDPKKISYRRLLQVFWEGHDPTQGMRQGNDVGTQNRSGVYVYSDAQRKKATETKAAYEKSLKKTGFGDVTTEIIDAPEFYYAEAYHQQYLAKNPRGYCGLGGTGVCLAS